MKLERLKANDQPELKLNVLQLKMKEQVSQKVKEKVYDFETVNCAVCNSAEKELIGEKDRYGLYFPVNVCRDCGLVYTSPRMTQAAYDAFYNTEYRKLYNGVESATKVFFDNQKKKGQHIFNYLSAHQLLKEDTKFVLEVGCGAGGIIDYFSDQGYEVKGIDLGAEYINYGKEKHGLDLETATLADISTAKKPDLIIYSHILEHILDINQEIELIKKFLKKNTLVYIEVPGVKEIHKNYQSNILRYFQNAHTFHFTLESLVNLMRKHGFELVEGNQFVKSVFMYSGKPQQPKNDYQSVNDYIDQIEKKRHLYPFTINAIKMNTKNMMLSLLDKSGTRKYAKQLREKITGK